MQMLEKEVESDKRVRWTEEASTCTLYYILFFFCFFVFFTTYLISDIWYLVFGICTFCLLLLTRYRHKIPQIPYIIVIPNLTKKAGGAGWKCQDFWGCGKLTELGTLL